MRSSASDISLFRLIGAFRENVVFKPAVHLRLYDGVVSLDVSFKSVIHYAAGHRALFNPITLPEQGSIVGAPTRG